MTLKLTFTIAAIVLLIIVASQTKIRPTSCGVSPVASFLDDEDACRG